MSLLPPPSKTVAVVEWIVLSILLLALAIWFLAV